MSDTPATTTGDEIRWPVLAKLAEQAMTDMAFREIARNDLERALEQYGYVLTDRERALVLRFRASLEEAGIDLDITSQFSADNIEMLRAVGESMLADAERESGDR
jgi:hypothetical protein